MERPRDSATRNTPNESPALRGPGPPETHSMPNNQSAILPVIFARALSTLREYAVMPRLVNSDYSSVPAGQGDTVNVSVPLAQAVTDVSPDQGPITPVDNTYEKRSLTLNRWRKAGFYLTDKERGDIGDGIVPMQLQESVKALANDVNAFLILQGKKFFTSVGAPGTDVFNGATWQAATTVVRSGLQKMAENVVPEGDRRFVLSPVSYSSALGVEGFVLANQRGSAENMFRGAIGSTMGLDWYQDQAVAGHTSTPLSAGAATVNGVNAAGSYTVSIAKLTNTSALVAGDIITFGGRSYAVAADVTLIVGNTTVTLTSPLRAATAGGETVTLLATQNRVNLMFHKDAIHFASRPLISEASDKRMSIADPVTGLALGMELIRQNKQDYIEFDILYGATSFRPELGVRVCD
jgi:hypothetical protein